mmetsp:Transcript_5628/g.21290  ORF Transcript_5628/g.21290 Transcript_5628/m.21290 type:complete len:209 (+) Transcript_5628:361-987(+)
MECPGLGERRAGRASLVGHGQEIASGSSLERATSYERHVVSRAGAVDLASCRRGRRRLDAEVRRALGGLVRQLPCALGHDGSGWCRGVARRLERDGASVPVDGHPVRGRPCGQHPRELALPPAVDGGPRAVPGSGAPGGSKRFGAVVPRVRRDHVHKGLCAGLDHGQRRAHLGGSGTGLVPAHRPPPPHLLRLIGRFGHARFARPGRQ